jgi:hypothetical protein
MGKRSKSQTTLSISVPKWLVQAIKREALKEHRSASGYITARMEAYLIKESPDKYGSHGPPSVAVNGNHNSIAITDTKNANKKP